ncbi:MAG: hypothetical protein FJZ56_06420 [Chlamydiae bacterium]|nr:hypothetical protein [Chlamydiota bacterium]
MFVNSNGNDQRAQVGSQQNGVNSSSNIPGAPNRQPNLSQTQPVHTYTNITANATGYSSAALSFSPNRNQQSPYDVGRRAQVGSRQNSTSTPTGAPQANPQTSFYPNIHQTRIVALAPRVISNQTNQTQAPAVNVFHLNPLVPPAPNNSPTSVTVTTTVTQLNTNQGMNSQRAVVGSANQNSLQRIPGRPSGAPR